jgi:hypothetical protein
MTLDYLPRSFALLLNWLVNFITYLNANYSRFSIPNAKVAALQTLITQFQTAQAKATTPNAGKADRLDRDEKAVAVKKATRTFVNANLRYNEQVTDLDKVNLGLHVPDPKPSPAPVPSSMPLVDLIFTAVIMRITLHYRDTNSPESRAKPFGVHGVEIVWAILSAPPTTTSDLIHSEFSTHSPHTFIFDENQRGKTVWFRLRWENNRGEKGPWSELYSAIIP